MIEFKYHGKDDLTYKVIGCLMKHNTLGMRFNRLFINDALLSNFKKAALTFGRKIE